MTNAMQHKMMCDSRTSGDAKKAMFVRGPYLTAEDRVVVVPSPLRKATLVKRMMRYGFVFAYDDVSSYWSRSVVQPYNGRGWTPEQWLELAVRCYEEAYPTWIKRAGR